ncbi:MAG: TIGR04219 family outer membrane beta-barrel protein [Nitrococcus sp.]|nr:TIGR04219 family outer membrane beta-barrel protein [Nitrococcus sp.]
MLVRQGLKALVAAAAVIGASAPAAADNVGIAAGAALWNYEPDGHARQDGNESFNLQNDLGLGTEWGGYAWIAVEHPVPVLPNIRLEYTRADTEGSGTVSQSFTIDGVSYAQGTDVSTKAELDQLDLVLYYKLLDNVVSLDVGLDIKYLDGRVRVRQDDTGESEAVSFRVPLPLLYGAARVDLPFAGMWVGGQVSGLAYDDDRLLDVRATLGYDFPFALGVQAGYRHQAIKLHDVNDLSADITVGGPFVGVHANF